MSEESQSPEETPFESAPAGGEAAAPAALEAEVAALKEQVLRYAADAENVRRRAERETNDARAYAIQKFARDLLGVADTLGRALASPPAGEDAGVRNFVVGVEMTQKALLSAFESNGLKAVSPAARGKVSRWTSSTGGSAKTVGMAATRAGSDTPSTS